MSSESDDKMLTELLKTYGLENITPAQARARSVREDVADYILTSHRLGAAGTALFTYDGYYDYTYYSLVDERGRSVNGKMEGVREAMEKISAAQNRPQMTLQVVPSAFMPLPRSLQVSAIAAPNATTQKAIISLQVEISGDGGSTWSAIREFTPTNTQFNCLLPHAFQRPNWMMMRARAFDGEKHSLWSVWNALPWAKPNAS